MSTLHEKNGTLWTFGSRWEKGTATVLTVKTVAVLFKDPDGLNAIATTYGGAAIGTAIGGPGIGTAVGAAVSLAVGLGIGAAATSLWNNSIIQSNITQFPDPNNPPDHWVPKGKDKYFDPTTGEWWIWHPDPGWDHGGDHWDIGGPRGPNGEPGQKDWWPAGGKRGPKPPGDKGLKDLKIQKVPLFQELRCLAVESVRRTLRDTIRRKTDNGEA